MNREEQHILLDSLAGVLIRCFFLTIALLLVWFIFFLLAGDVGFYLHSRWFEIDGRDYDLLFYYGMAFLKICAFVFFLFPYIAIRLVIRKKG
jgi:heme/copper-type cytochrome/quinol oxidase subunit 2